LGNNVVAFIVSDFDQDFKSFLKLTFDDWHNGALLDRRWALETISVDTCIFVNPSSAQILLFETYLEEARALGSWCRRSRQSRHSWIRFDLRKDYHQRSNICLSQRGVAVCLLQDRRSLPSGISSSPLSVAMIAVY